MDSSEVLWERNGWRRCIYRGHRDDHESDSSPKGFLHTARLGPAFPRWNPLSIVVFADVTSTQTLLLRKLRHSYLAAYLVNMTGSRSHKSYTTTLLLALLGGAFGAHRFYAGKVGTGILFLFTLGFFFIGQLVDVFTVAFGNFTDKSGRFIRPKG